MHKKTSRDEITPKTPKTITHKMPKSRLCGVWERMRQSRVYIASVGSPSGRYINIVRTRAALGTSRQVARVWTQSGPVRTIGLHSRPDHLSVWMSIETVRTLRTETLENWEKFTQIKFFKVSFRTCMYKLLITQSESISKFKQRYKRELRNQSVQISS